MNFKESALSQHLFLEHADNNSMVGGMPITSLLSNPAFSGGSKIESSIANLENGRFKNLVVPVGFYMERGPSGAVGGGAQEYPQYINEKAFEELFNIPVQTKSSTRSNRPKISNKRSKKHM